MIGKLNRGITIKHKVIVIITLDEDVCTVYDKSKSINLLGGNSITNTFYKIPVQVLSNTPNLLVVKQINTTKFERISI